MHLGDLLLLIGDDPPGEVLACGFSPWACSVCAIWMAPLWCWIIIDRNDLSNAGPDSVESWLISASLIIPGIDDPGAMPGMAGIPVAFGATVGAPHAASMEFISSISGPCAPEIFVARSLTSGDDARLDACPAMLIAWVW